MIDEPLLLTLRRGFPRPDPARLEPFRDVPTSMLADARNGQGALPGAIKPLPFGLTLLGPAVTARCHPGDNLAALASLEAARPGDVLVIAGGGNEALAALIGDRFAAIARNRGVAGIVVDGPVRDAAGIAATGLACFCRGTTPNSGFAHGPGEVGGTISIGAVTIAPGDVIVGDADGVVVIPQGEIDATLARLRQVEIAEKALEERIAQGLDHLPSIRRLIESPRVRVIDSRYS